MTLKQSPLFIRFVMPMLFAVLIPATAQQESIGVPLSPLGTAPFVLDTAEQHKIRVTVVTRGLVHPWSLVFLPDGSMLVTSALSRLDCAFSPKRSWTVR
jgi:glucose/arabinose dehydrogenase